MLAMAAGQDFLPRFLHRKILLRLRTVESATRRLIYAIARSILVPYVKKERKPRGRSDRKARRGPRKALFRLTDPPHRESTGRKKTSSLPPFFVCDPSDPAPPEKVPEKPKPEDRLDTGSLLARLRALHAALSDLDGQALRMAKLLDRKDAKEPKATGHSPLRRGRPPGWRKRPRFAVDHILRDAHHLTFGPRVLAPP